MSPTTITIGSRTIGAGHPAYVIAEAGSNHNRDLSLARRLIEVAAEAGADAVKFQTFRAASLYARGAGQSDYLGSPRSIFDIIRDLEMPFDWIPLLAAEARAHGLDFLSTPFDEAAVDLLAPHVAAFKIASYEMTHHILVQHAARRGKPLIVSTGTATLAEVREMVEAVEAAGDPGLVLLQCTAKYPAPLETLNLRALQTLGRELGRPVGLSDHSRDPVTAPAAAVALGASVIEKHFTLSNRLPGPDHGYALEPADLRAMVRAIRDVERAMGDGDKAPHEAERELRAFARRSVFTLAPVAEGELLRRDNLAVLRCGKLAPGLHPRDYLAQLGRAARRPLPADHAVVDGDTLDVRLADGDVAIRPLSLEDTDLVVAWRQRPEIHAQFFAERPPTRDDHLRFFAALARRNDRREFIVLLDDRPVGTIGLSRIDLGRGEAEYGVLLGDPAVRGRGVALRASALILAYAFDVLGLSRVVLELFADNEVARRLYDRAGFVEVLPAPPPREKDGRTRAITRMAIDRAAWLARREGAAR